MAAEKKTKRKQARVRKNSRAVTTRKSAKKAAAGKSPAKRKSAVGATRARKKVVAISKAVQSKRKRKIIRSKAVSVPKKAAPRLKRAKEATEFPLEAPVRRAGVQSGDLQGLSDVEGANSESVGELIEEGNAFEADAIAGVERAEDSEGSEVHTHEVPEDDVPQEYLDED